MMHVRRNLLQAEAFSINAHGRMPTIVVVHRLSPRSCGDDMVLLAGAYAPAII